MDIQDVDKVPPNGKWGWMIVLAYALNGIATISIMQGFGLIFKDLFPRLGLNATEGSVVLNTNLAFGMILGLINGPLLQILGYRKMAVIGSVCYSVGVTTTAFANSFAPLMLFYGIFASMGSSITLSAFSYALNSYFTTKRGRAMSLALTIIGLGPVIVPQITTFFISFYGFQGTILLYGALSLHSLVGSTLLHPLKWHTKDARKTETTNASSVKNEKGNEIIEENYGDENNKVSTSDLSTLQRKRKITISSIDHDSEIGSIYGIDIPYARQMSETISGRKEPDVYTVVENGQGEKDYLKNIFLKSRYKSVDEINLGSSFTIFEEKPIKKCYSTNELDMNTNSLQSVREHDLLLQKKDEDTRSNGKVDKDEKSEKKSSDLNIFKRIEKVFDLDLLRDPKYVNIMLGMSIAIFAEINFSQLTPFILMEMKFSTEHIANIMSIIAGVDLLFRIVSPFIGEWLDQPPREMYLLSLCLLIVSRTTLLFVGEFTPTIIVAIGLGAAKGIRSVYMTLVIPHYVPIQKLPNASGLQMIVNGVILLSAGPVLGAIRDSVGSYRPCIIVINCVTVITVTMWSVEILISRRKKGRKQSDQEEIKT